MPRRRKTAVADVNTSPSRGTTSDLPKELIDQLLAAAGGGAGLTGPDGLLKKLTAALVNRALDAEMSEHLGYEAGQPPPDAQDNRRNGRRTKQVRTERGDMAVEVPRDRAGTFEPRLVGKHQRSFDGFDDQILSLYARGMSTRDIQRHLGELYGVEVSPDLVSRVTDAVLDELGPAVNARHSIFIYGPPGNGKSQMARRIQRMLAGTIAVPHAIAWRRTSPSARSSRASRPRKPPAKLSPAPVGSVSATTGCDDSSSRRPQFRRLLP